MGSRSSSSDPGWVLELPQPLASCVVEGRMGGANLWVAPSDRQLGQRVVISAGPVNTHDLWLLPRLGVQLPEWSTKKPLPLGVIGTVVVQGCIHWRGGALRQVRADGLDRPLRPFRGISGPFAWVLRAPSRTLPRTGIALERIAGGYWDQPDVQAQLLWYESRYGSSGFDPELVTHLERARAQRKARQSDRPNNNNSDGEHTQSP